MLASSSEDFDTGLVVALQESEQLAGDAASQAPFGVASALALGGAPGQVDAGLGVDAQAHQQDGVQGISSFSARVSKADQNPALQHDALAAAGCYRVFTDTASGSLDARPELTRVLDQLRPGDTLVVWKLDRLGRSLRHLIDTVTALEERGVGFAASPRPSTPPHPAASWPSTCSARWPSSSVT